MKDLSHISDAELLLEYKDRIEMVKRIEELESDLKEVASLILTTGYTIDDNGNRVMDANEYKWIDAAAAILKKYHKRKL